MIKMTTVAHFCGSLFRLKFHRKTFVFSRQTIYVLNSAVSLTLTVSMARGRAAPAAVVADDDDGGSGFEKWTDLQTLALGWAWNKVSRDATSNGTSQKKDSFWELVGIAYHTCYRELGGVDTSRGKKKRNGMAADCYTFDIYSH